MADAATIITALGGRWHGSYALCRCPAHDDRSPSLSITDGEDGRTLLKCHGGCSQEDVMDALRARGLWGREISATCADLSRQSVAKTTAKREGVSRQDDAKRTEAAREIWKAAQPADGTLVASYLAARGINARSSVPAKSSTSTSLPPTLRFSPALKYTPSGIYLPAMVAAVQAVDRRIVAVHRTFLDPRGDRKAQVASPKMALGPIGDGAVRLAAAGKSLGIAEGIETALSAMQLFDVPCWAALGARTNKVAIPFTVEDIVIFADNGTQGREAAEKAADRFTSEGRKVTLRFPPEGDGDWNDTLRSRA